jgi:hypothetical protein
MAISPKMLDEKFMDEVSLFEKMLDSQLATSKFGTNKTVQISIPSGMSHAHFQILKERYKSVGWSDITWNSDQREGDWLTFRG